MLFKFIGQQRYQSCSTAAATSPTAANYHDIDRINVRKDNVHRLWQYLLELLGARRMRLELSLQLQQNFQVFNQELVRLFRYIPRADINVLGERVKMVVQHSQRFLETKATGGFGPCDPAIIDDRVQQLEVLNDHK